MSELKVLTFSPKDPKYAGRDAATILDMGEGMYFAVYCSESAGGLGQVVANSDRRSVVMFSHINQEFYKDAVEPLAREI